MKRKFTTVILGLLLSIPTITNAVIIDAGATFEGGHSIDFSIDVSDTYVWQEGINSVPTTAMPFTFLSLVIDAVDVTPGGILDTPLLMLTEGVDSATIFGDSAADTWELSTSNASGRLSIGADMFRITTTDGTNSFAATQFYLNVRNTGPDPVPPSSIPEPGMLGLLAIGLIGVGLVRRRKTV